MRDLFLLLFIACYSLTHAQNAKGLTVINTEANNAIGNSYGLIIGISQYENFPSLQYADKDAQAFYNFLRSKPMSVPDSNIRMMTNDKAKAGNIWSGLSWLQRKAVNKGDRVFIYFSGHGDAANEAEAYLLAYDAPNAGDPNLYNAGGTFQIYNLKMKIRELTAKGLQVVLITDACRSNELPGHSEGAKWAFDKIMEKSSGEIQMASCAANEQSLESKDWGGGRGIFSYHLVNALMGMADVDPEDNEVTLSEIERYVKDNVRKDTRSVSTNKARQNPVFCCGEMDQTTIARVDEPSKNKLMAMLSGSSDNNTLAMAGKKGVISKDPEIVRLYEQFQAAIDSHKLITPELSCAYFYYKKMKEKIKGDDQLSDINDAFSAALNTEVQSKINGWIMDNEKNESLKPKLQYQHLEMIEKILGKDNALALENRPKKIWMYIMSQEDNLNLESQQSKLAMLDSAIAINPRLAYLYAFRGKYLLTLSRSNESIEAFREALTLAPNWLIANAGYAAALSDIGSDSSGYYAEKAYRIDSSNYTALNGMAVSLLNQGKFNQSVYYLKRLISLYPKSDVGHYYLGVCYNQMGQSDSAYRCYSRASAIDSSVYYIYSMALLKYTAMKDTLAAIRLLQTGLRLEPKHLNSRYAIALLYAAKRDYTASLRELEIWIKAMQDEKKQVKREDLIKEIEFAVIKSDHRFIELLDKMSLK